MIKNFILKVQNSDDTTKRFWLFLLSGVTMAAVLGLWLGYVNLTLARVAPPSAPTPSVEIAQETEIGGPGFFTIFSAGVKIIYDKIAEQVAVKHSIIIENPQRNFALEGLPAIPTTKLPNGKK